MAASQLIITMIRFTLLFYVLIKTSSGRISPRPYIINGIDAVPHSRPWMVSIQRKTSSAGPNTVHFDHICGGTLIFKKWVLTAASCVTHPDKTIFSPHLIELHLGVHNVSYEKWSNPVGVQRIAAAQILPHKNFDKEKMYHNIALIKMASAAKLNRYVKKIALAAHKKFLKVHSLGSHIGWGVSIQAGVYDETKTYGMDKECHVTGKKLKETNYDVHLACGRWYATVYEGDPQVRIVQLAPSPLQEMYIRIISQKACAERIKIDTRYRNTVMCGVDEIHDRSFCWEDIGGPLAVHKHGKWVQHGIASYLHGWNNLNKKCGMKGNPQLFTRVALYRNWIKTKMKATVG